MYEQHLVQAGLSPEQAEIYEILAKNGQLSAGNINQKTPIKRGLVYKILEQLIGLDLIEKEEDPGKVAIFKAKHPLKLKDLAQKREQQAKDAQLALDGVLPSIISDFNLVSDKPGIQFYEGFTGIKTVADDSLTAKSEIYSYIDNEAVNKYTPKINEGYIEKRTKLGLKKKMITFDNDYIRKRADSFNRELTDIHLIATKIKSFSTVMQIYDNKVSYITLDENKKIGIIIVDEHIAQMHKALFEYMWQSSLPLFEIKKTTADKPVANSSYI